MLEFSNSVSIGDAAVVCGFIGSIGYNYYAVVRRVDRIANRQDNLETTVTDLRHGTGLVLPGNWPMPVRRCFGFGYDRGVDDGNR